MPREVNAFWTNAALPGGGFGLKLITRLAEKELGGSATMDWRREGLHAEIDFLTSIAS